MEMQILEEKHWNWKAWKWENIFIWKSSSKSIYNTISISAKLYNRRGKCNRLQHMELHCLIMSGTRTKIDYCCEIWENIYFSCLYKGMRSLLSLLQKTSKEVVEVSCTLSIQHICKFLVRSGLNCSHRTLGT